MEAVKRYAVLWHLTRDIRDQLSPSGSLRRFDRYAKKRNFRFYWQLSLISSQISKKRNYRFY